MKTILMAVLLLFSWQLTAQARTDCEERAAREYEQALYACRVNDPSPPPYDPNPPYNPPHNPPTYRCVKNCESRWSDGSCARWGADFCGPNAVCAANCESRWSDGSCARWGADECYASNIVLDAKKIESLKLSTSKLTIKK